VLPKPCDSLVLKCYMREQECKNSCIDMFSVRPLRDHGFSLFSLIITRTVGVTKRFRFTQGVGLYWPSLRACFCMQITCLCHHPELLFSVVDETMKPVNLLCCSLKLLAIRTKLFVTVEAVHCVLVGPSTEYQYSFTWSTLRLICVIGVG
jgi:hypothetical protein